MMKTEFIKKGNHIISQFMGKIPIPKSEFNAAIHASENSSYEVLEFTRYHREWNWLMPVVEKIENIGNTLISIIYSKLRYFVWNKKS